MMKHSFSILSFLLLALVTLSTAANVGGLRHRRQQRRALSDESKSELREEFKGVKVVDIDSASENKDSDSASSSNGKAIRPGSFSNQPNIQEKFALYKTSFHGKKYRRPLAQPDACCCACMSLPCECSCDSPPDTEAELLKLGNIVDGETETDEERRQRERAERKAKRKAARREQKRLEREKQRQEEERRKKEAAEQQDKSASIEDEDSNEEPSESKEGQSGRRLGSMSSEREPKATPWKHYTESSVLCACCQCSSYPCTCRPNMLVFRMDNM